MVNPIRHVDANVLAKYSLERFGYEIAIVRMQNGQPFRECRNAFRWIETEENERLRRPVIEYAIGPKRPAPHMSQASSLAQVKFASLEIREWPLRPVRLSAQAVAFHIFLLRRFEIVAARTARGQSQLSVWVVGLEPEVSKSGAFANFATAANRFST